MEVYNILVLTVSAHLWISAFFSCIIHYIYVLYFLLSPCIIWALQQLSFFRYLSYKNLIILCQTSVWSASVLNNLDPI
jgi:hypothetical protein